MPEGVRLDAIQLAELADWETRNDAGDRILPLRKELARVWDQPLRELTLEIDQDTWPDASGSVLELVIRLDIFKGSAHVLIRTVRRGLDGAPMRDSRSGRR